MEVIKEGHIKNLAITLKDMFISILNQNDDAENARIVLANLAMNEYITDEHYKYILDNFDEWYSEWLEYNGCD
jgi:hypothetical protein